MKKYKVKGEGRSTIINEKELKNNLDDEIAPMVYLLLKHNFKTCSSCSGHGEINPWIRIAADSAKFGFKPKYQSDANWTNSYEKDIDLTATKKRLIKLLLKYKLPFFRIIEETEYRTWFKPHSKTHYLYLEFASIEALESFTLL